MPESSLFSVLFSSPWIPIGAFIGFIYGARIVLKDVMSQGIFVSTFVFILISKTNEPLAMALFIGQILGIFAALFFRTTELMFGGYSRPHMSTSPNGFEDVGDFDDETLFANQADAGSTEPPPPTEPAKPTKDYYAILGLERGASAAEIKDAYRKLLKTCHPDLFPGDKEKEALAKDINEAHDVLSDEQKRAAYDRGEI